MDVLCFFFNRDSISLEYKHFTCVHGKSKETCAEHVMYKSIPRETKYKPVQNTSHHTTSMNNLSMLTRLVCNIGKNVSCGSQSSCWNGTISWDRREQLCAIAAKTLHSICLFWAWLPSTFNKMDQKRVCLQLASRLWQCERKNLTCSCLSPAFVPRECLECPSNGNNHNKYWRLLPGCMVRIASVPTVCWASVLLLALIQFFHLAIACATVQKGPAPKKHVLPERGPKQCMKDSKGKCGKDQGTSVAPS